MNDVHGGKRIDISDGQQADIQTAYSALAGEDGFINADSFKKMCSSFELTIDPALLETMQKTEPTTKRSVIHMENFFRMMADPPEKQDHTVSYSGYLQMSQDSNEFPAVPQRARRRVRRSSPPAIEKKDRKIHVRGRMKHIHEDSTIQKPYWGGSIEEGDAVRRGSVVKLAESIFSGMKAERKLQSSKGKRSLSTMPYKLMVDIAARRITSFFRIALAKKRMQELKAIKHLRRREPGTPREEGVQARLIVNVIEAVDLVPMDGVAGQNFSSDPFVRVELKENYTRETDVQQKTLNPSFREEFEFWVYDPNELMYFRVLDRDYGTSDDLIGWGAVPLSAMPRERPLYVTMHLLSGANRDLQHHSKSKDAKDRARANILHLRLLAKGFGSDNAKGRIVVRGDKIVTDEVIARTKSPTKKRVTVPQECTRATAPLKRFQKVAHAIRLPSLLASKVEYTGNLKQVLRDTFELDAVREPAPMVMSPTAANKLLQSVRQLNASMIIHSGRERLYVH